MNGRRFDELTKGLFRKGAVGGAAAAAFALPTAAFAQDDDTTDSDVAAAGNGGYAEANANGGAISITSIDTGYNSGSAIGVGNTAASGGDALVAIDGGDVTNTTAISVSADGGLAAADASGGDGNVATNVDSNVFVFVS